MPTAHIPCAHCVLCRRPLCPPSVDTEPLNLVSMPSAGQGSLLQRCVRPGATAIFVNSAEPAEHIISSHVLRTGQGLAAAAHPGVRAARGHPSGSSRGQRGRPAGAGGGRPGRVEGGHCHWLQPRVRFAVGSFATRAPTSACWGGWALQAGALQAGARARRGP